MKHLDKTFKALLLAGMCLAAGATAAEEYPAHALTIVVPFPSGGGVDNVARLLAERLQESLKQTVLVANKPGDSGMTGASTVVKSKADGYTLLLGTAGETAIQPLLYKGKMPYQPERDLLPVTLVAKVPNVLVVRPDLAVKQADDLIALAKKSPGKLTYSSSGTGSTQHLNGELFNLLTGVQLAHVPAKGAAEQLANVIAGKVDMTFVSYAAAREAIKNSKVKAIAVTSSKRASFAPEIPALAESRPLAQYQLGNWFGFFVPANTPNVVIQKLNEAIVAILKRDDVAQRMREQGTEAVFSTPEQFRDFIKTQSTQFAKTIETAKISSE